MNNILLVPPNQNSCFRSIGEHHWNLGKQIFRKHLEMLSLDEKHREMFMIVHIHYSSKTVHQLSYDNGIFIKNRYRFDDLDESLTCGKVYYADDIRASTHNVSNWPLLNAQYEHLLFAIFVVLSPRPLSKHKLKITSIDTLNNFINLSA